MSASPVFFLTDFGLEDPYVGIMKSVVLDWSPGGNVVDLTHYVPRFSEMAAAFMLEYSLPCLPSAAVVSIVVDPGVGGDRRIIGVKLKNGVEIIAPDTGIVEGLDWQEVRRVENDKYFLDLPGKTFDGRDKFAPVAGFLSSGGEFKKVGRQLERKPAGSIVPAPEREPGFIQGEVVYYDHFGNCITNLPPDLIPRNKQPLFKFKGQKIQGLETNYQSRRDLVALVGSYRRIEFAVPRGSAKEQFAVEIGDKFKVHLE